MPNKDTKDTIISCNAPYGSGGMGRHLAELAEHTNRNGHLKRYYSTGVVPEHRDNGLGVEISQRLTGLICQYSPIRFDAARRQHITFDRFDRAVANRLEGNADTLIAFAGQALHTFGRARRAKVRHLLLIAPTSHINNVVRQCAAAFSKHPVDSGWVTEAQQKKVLAEYQAADQIQISSEYVRQTFLAEGIPESKLIKYYLKADPRFQPPSSPREKNGVFRVVYTGSLTTMKGVPLLLDAFSRFKVPAAELILVGGSGTRAMRKYLEQHLAMDTRVRIAPGDPLPILQKADLYVHPSYEDGFGYAPMEAMACGVPVIVTEDTGMKEHIQPGVNGWIIPTGDSQALTNAIQQIYEGQSNSLLIGQAREHRQ